MPILASLFPALRHRDFRRLWGGVICSTGGHWLQIATFGWVTYQITGSATLLGAVIGSRGITMLIFAPISGVIADRHDRRRLLAMAQLPVIVVSLALALLLMLEAVRVWHLFAFTLIAGVSNVFERTLRNSLTMDLVPRSELANAVALNTIAFSAARTLAPAMAGYLLAWVGASWTFVLQACLYAALAMTALSLRPAIKDPASASIRGSAWYEMKEGWRFGVTHPIARLMLLMGLVPPLMLIPSFSALMPVFTVKVFNAGPETLGLMLASIGVGCVFGSVGATALSRYERVGKLQTVSLILFALALIGFALSPQMHTAIVFLFLAGAAEMVLSSSSNSTLQMSAPSDMRGRVASLMAIYPATISLGGLFAGAGADLLGVQPQVIVTALLAIVISTGVWLGSTHMRSLTLSRLVKDGEPTRARH